VAAIPPLLKDMNERAVLEAIRAWAPISRAQISRRAGISKPTVSLALQALLDGGLVREASDDPAGPRYGATFFEPVPDAALVVGLDLGARFLRGAVCDLRGEVRARQDVELSPADAEEAVDAIAALHDSLLAAAGASLDLVDATVLGVPGVVDATSQRIHLTTVAGLEGTDFARQVAARLDGDVTLENDINLAALGERWRGVARGIDDFVFMSIGTGLGSGVVLRGELVRGRHGAAGELDYAHVGLDADNDPCAEAVSAFAARIAVQAGGHALHAPYDVPAIFAASRGGDATARTVVDEVARRIAVHIAPVAAVVDVELVVLGGGVGANGDLLLEPVRALLARWLPYPPRVESSSLGDAAVLTGALSVGLSAALESVFVNRGRARTLSP
jgi:predicted NBD/HSP70 family sugar kinase